MKTIFANNYQDDAQRVAATLGWVKNVLKGAEPDHAPVLRPSVRHPKPNESLGATKFWKIRSPNSDNGYALLLQTLSSKTPNTHCEGEVALGYLVKPFAGFSLRLIQFGNDSSDILACYAFEGEIFVFDPRTALWQMNGPEPRNFIAQMRKRIGQDRHTELISWVVPVSCAQVARRIAGDKTSVAYGKANQMQCWQAVSYCALLCGVIDERRFWEVADDASLDRQTQFHPVLATRNDPEVHSREEMTRVPSDHAVCFFREARTNDIAAPNGKIWITIHTMLSLGNGMVAGVKNMCLETSGNQPFGRNAWEILDARELDWGNGYLRRGPQQIRVHHRPIADLARSQGAGSVHDDG